MKKHLYNVRSMPLKGGPVSGQFPAYSGLFCGPPLPTAPRRPQAGLGGSSGIPPAGRLGLVELTVCNRLLRFRKFSSFIILFFYVPALIVQAQANEDVFQHPLSAESLPRYNEVCGVLSSHPIVKGTFTQRKIIRRLNRFLDSGGKFVIDADRGMIWETLNPFPSTMAVGRDYLIQSVPGGSKTVLDARGNETFLRLADTMSAVFSGRAAELRNNFENFFTDSGGKWKLGLLPSEKAVRSFAARIILEGDSVVRSIILHEQNGDTIRYELSNHSFSGALSPHEAALFSRP